MITKLTKVAGAMALAMAISAPAQATPISGDITFGGLLNLTGGANFGSSTGIDFGAVTVMSGSGDFSGIPAPFVTPVSFTDFSFASFPVGGITPLWSFSSGSYSFDLLTLSIDLHTANDLNLSGTGILHAPGLDDTQALWDFSSQSSAGGKFNLSFSADNSAATVPEPMSLGLLGTGLVMLAARGKKATAKAA